MIFFNLKIKRTETTLLGISSNKNVKYILKVLVNDREVKKKTKNVLNALMCIFSVLMQE